MKKRKAVSSGKLPPPKKMSKRQFEQQAKRNSDAIQGKDPRNLGGSKTDIAGVVERKVREEANKSNPPPAVHVLPTGVYFDRERRVAIVHRVGAHNVHVVRIGEDATIEACTLSALVFTRRYVGRWPAYPLRRAARLLMESHLAKSPDAARILKVMLAQ